MSKKLHILILRPGAIGDSLLTFPVLQALRQQYSNSYLTLAGNAAVLPLALKWGIAEEVADFSSIEWSELFSTKGIHSDSLQKRLQDCELAVCWLQDAEGILKHNLLQAGVSRIVIAPGRPQPGQSIHITEYLASSIGLQLPEDHLSLPLVPSEITPMCNETVAIHPGSGGRAKCWPVDRFATLISALWEQQKPVLLLAGPADQQLLQELLERLPSPPEASMLNILNNSALTDLAERVRHCYCYIGNDSGITHLAALLDMPTIVLFGPSDPQVWRPVGSKVKVIREAALKDLQVTTVLNVLKSCKTESDTIPTYKAGKGKQRIE